MPRSFCSFASLLVAAGLMLLDVGVSGAAERPMIEQIEIDGVAALTIEELQSALELEAGDRFDAERANGSAQGLSDLYRFRGYPQVEVRSEFDATLRLWRLRVIEGAPVRVRAVEILGEGAQVRAAGRSWRILEGELLRRFELGPGDVFDQERAAAGARAVQSLLLGEEYIGAKVNEVQVVRGVGEPPASELSVRGLPAADWVRLRIRVDPGEKVSFGFRGNHFFTRNELLQLVREQRLLGLGGNYIETLKVRFEEAYRASGFPNASVAAFPVERASRFERHVTWVVEEGARARLQQLEFDGGVAFSRAQLEEIFWDGIGGHLSAGVYVQKELDRAVEVFIQKLKSRGYLGARLLSLQTLWNERHSGASGVVFFYEGEQTRVGSVEIVGPEAPASDEAARILGVGPGEPLNLFAFTEGVQRLKSWYRDRGHLEVGIVGEGGSDLVRYRDDNRVADIRVEVDPGRKYRVGSISIEGRGKAALDVVLRELAVREGEVLTESDILESESRLRRLGLFSSAQIRLDDDPRDPSLKRVLVLLQEGVPGLVAGGVGFRNDLGLRAFGQTSYSNLFGRNHTVVFSVNANRRFEERRVPLESQAQIGYVWPWFLIPEMTFRPTLTFQRTQYENFDATSLVLGGTLEKRLFRRPNLLATLSYTLERIEQKATDPLSIDNQTITIGALTGSLKLDLRNDPLAPTRGFYAGISYEISDPALLSQVDPFPIGYTRVQFRSDYLLPVWRNASWYFSFRTGLERNTQDITDPRVAIPLIKQFTLGGAGSLRGFREQELNVQDIAIRGTAAYVNYRVQLDLPLSGPMRFGPFLDAANLLVDEYSLNKNLRMGTGLGLHYLTPVGPVNFDLGFKIDPRPDEEPYRFYFSIGVI